MVKICVQILNLPLFKGKKKKKKKKKIQTNPKAHIKLFNSVTCKNDKI